MAEKQWFPQVPSTVWWGVRSALQKTPKAIIDERFLGVNLNVQAAAAKQYVRELKGVGILDEDCRATPLANKWRLDETYAEATKELIQRIYPEGLLHLSSPADGERQKVVSWFQHEGLGQGAAGNKAATYFLIGSASPNDAPAKTGARSTASNGKAAKKSQSKNTVRAGAAVPIQTLGTTDATSRKASQHSQMPLNVNVQIHISSDAGVEQIDAIFAAMKRYLSNEPAD